MRSWVRFAAVLLTMSIGASAGELPKGRRHVAPDSVNMYRQAVAKYARAYSILKLPEGLEAAKAVYREAFSKFPTDVELHRSYQDFMRRVGSAADIEKEYRGKLAADSASPVFNYLVGRLAGTVEEQKRRAERAIELDAGFYWGHLLLGSYHAKMKDYEHSRSELERAVAIDNSLPYAFVALGDNALAQGDSSTALALYSEALVCEPSDASSRAPILAEALGRHDEQARLLKIYEPEAWEAGEFESFVGTRARHYADIGYAHAHARQFDSSQAYFDRAFALESVLGRDWKAEAFCDLACNDALQGKSKLAFFYLDSAYAYGFNDYSRLRDDEDLMSLRALPRFKKLAEDMRLARRRTVLAERSNRPAPQFSLKDLSGETFALADLKGKPVFIEFWATWCYWCKKALPIYEQFYRDHKDGAHFFAVNTEGEALRAKAESFMNEAGHTVPVLFADQATVAVYDARAIPLFVVIDADGDIAFTKRGYSDGLYDELSWFLDALTH